MKSVIRPTTSIGEASQIIDETGIKTIFVTDKDNILLGILSSGDIRRAVLLGGTGNQSVETYMNKNPIVSKNSEVPVSLIRMMRSKGIGCMPIVDDQGRLIKVELIEDLLLPSEKENWVVLMAGGQGVRLRPLTETCPKPLLKVGQKAILETILENLISHGFYRFFISVNYMADMIVDYFGDGSRWGVNIEYLVEGECLGTAGSLNLLPAIPSKPILVMNGDILTRMNFEALIEHHEKYNFQTTMCVREYSHQVPYGVITAAGSKLISIEEKPIHNYYVSAGIYVLNPGLISLIPRNTYIDMPTLFQKAIEKRYDNSIYTIEDYWLDVGRHSDFERANGEYFEVFSAKDRAGCLGAS